MIDQAIIEFDKALRTVFAPARSVRAVPGEDVPDAELGETERSHAAALMRVNHVGEVCAQALYQGQSIMSRDPAIRDTLRQASQEETEHLAWTERRIAELGGRKSLLNPLWYGGALAIGMLGGASATAGTLASWPKPSVRSSITSRATSTRCRRPICARAPSSSR